MSRTAQNVAILGFALVSSALTLAATVWAVRPVRDSRVAPAHPVVQVRGAAAEVVLSPRCADGGKNQVAVPARNRAVSGVGSALDTRRLDDFSAAGVELFVAQLLIVALDEDLLADFDGGVVGPSRLGVRAACEDDEGKSKALHVGRIAS